MAGIEDPQSYALEVASRPQAIRVYRGVLAFVQRALYPYFKVKVIGNTNALNQDGALIVAPVHRSNLDSVLVAGASKRRIRALAKHTMFKSQPFAWLISSLGAFPVERGTADREALRAARDILDQGEAMFVFPEGTRQEGREITEIFDGVAYLASKTSATVVPVGIAGTAESMPAGRKFPRRTKVVLAIGEPIAPPVAAGKRVTIGERAAYSEVLRKALADLQQRAYAERAKS